MFDFFNLLQFVFRMVQETQKVMENFMTVQQITAGFLSFFRNHNISVFFKFDIARVLQVVYHFRRGRGLDMQAPGKLADADYLVALQKPADHFQIILHGGSQFFVFVPAVSF